MIRVAGYFLRYDALTDLVVLGSFLGLLSCLSDGPSAI